MKNSSVWMMSGLLAIAAAPAGIASTADIAALKPTLAIGDRAPALQPMAWIQGEPVTGFKPGQVYVVEFWATWCGPCVRSMPHLSALQKQYEGRLTVIGVNVRETLRSAGTLESVEKFVRKQGEKLTYAVAMDDPDRKTVFDVWQGAAGSGSVPTAFIVDGKGIVVWIGPPAGTHLPAFDAAVEQALQGKSDLAAARELAREVFLDSAILVRFHRTLEKMLLADEKKAIAFANEVGADAELRRTIAGERESAFWSIVGMSIGKENGFSADTYRLARTYLRSAIDDKFAGVRTWLYLSRVEEKLGNTQATAAALEGARITATEAGLTPEDFVWARQNIATQATRQ